MAVLGQSESDHHHDVHYDEIGNLEAETVAGGIPGESGEATPNSLPPCPGLFYCLCGTPTCIDGTWRCVGSCGVDSHVVATYRYGENGAPPHALTSSGATTTYTYDAAGRQTGDGHRTFTYNTSGLPRLISSSSSGTITFRYDAKGNRVLKRGPTETSVTVASLFERRVPADNAGETTNVHSTMAAGRVVAQIAKVQPTPSAAVNRTEVLYLHTDGLGSVTQTSNTSGAVVAEHFYDPFGRSTNRHYNEYGPDTDYRQVRPGFTGHEHDPELGLVNMRGRIYAPYLRRFLTPDPFITSPLSSQNYNRYSYVWNNPATFTDPTGFSCESEGIDCDAEITNQATGGFPFPFDPTGRTD